MTSVLFLCLQGVEGVAYCYGDLEIAKAALIKDLMSSSACADGNVGWVGGGGGTAVIPFRATFTPESRGRVGFGSVACVLFRV